MNSSSAFGLTEKIFQKCKIAEPFFEKNLILPKFDQTCQKMAVIAQNHSIWDFAKNDPNEFPKIELKVDKK